MADLNRDRILAGLEALGDEDDDTVLSAARELHAQIAAAGVAWQDLLRPEHEESEPDPDEDVLDDDDLDDDDLDDDDLDEDEPDRAPDPVPVEGDDLALVEALLRRPKLYEGTREELEDYKQDIEAGEFNADDRKYLRALAARLNKKQRPR